MSIEPPTLLNEILGHDDPRTQWDRAIASERMHHAWMLQGPRGVGKAHFALRLAADMLGVPAGETEHPVAQLIAAGSHPDLRLVRIPVDDKGKAKTEIPVDVIRELSRFFAMSPAMGGWRIGVIDALGELNRNSANALLKTLEEPPPRSLLLLVSHDGGAVLPTIRSRCRVLRMRKLAPEHALAVVEAAGMNAKDAAAALELAPGQPGLALELASAEGLAGSRAAKGVVGARRQSGPQALKALVKDGGKSATSFQAALTAITNDLIANARTENDPARSGALATKAAEIRSLWQEAEALKMDRAQALVRVVETLHEGEAG